MDAAVLGLRVVVINTRTHRLEEVRVVIKHYARKITADLLAMVIVPQASQALALHYRTEESLAFVVCDLVLILRQEDDSRVRIPAALICDPVIT